MVLHSRSAYGPNPNAGHNPNAQNGWGGYQWPKGVPANLLAVVIVPGGVKIQIRKELAELVGLMYQIALVEFGRDFHAGWTGGYMNRAITNTTTPSNHSRGRAIDNDAQNNPQSRTFRCDIPPGLVAVWESLGWYWGGRYDGVHTKFDPMHFEYCFSPQAVPSHVARAKVVLAAAQPAPSPKVPVPPLTVTPPSREFRMIMKIDLPAGDPHHDTIWCVDFLAHTKWAIHSMNELGFLKNMGVPQNNDLQAAWVLDGYRDVS